MGVTWSELWDRYEPEIEQLEAPATRRSEGKHIVRLLGAEPVAGTDADRVRAYRKARRGELTIRRRPPSHKTINNEVIAIRHLTKLAMRRGWEPADPLAPATEADLLAPVQNVRSNVVDNDPNAQLSLDQFLALADPFERAMVLVAHSSGVRRTELARMQLGWIDVRQRLIHIPAGISKGRRGNKNARTGIVSREAIVAVARYRRTLPEAARFVSAVFVNTRQMSGLHKDYFSRRWKKLERRVGVDGPSGPTWLHDLRRSFITLARWGGEDAVNVMKLVGHTTLESQERYHVESMREVIGMRDRIEAARRPARRVPRRQDASRFALS